MYQKISILKSIIWRIIGVFYLFIISFLTTGSLPQSSAITVIHHTIFLVVFFLQDRAWMRIEWGKEYWSRGGCGWYVDSWTPTKLRSLVKGFVYEIIIAIPIMLIIGFLVTGRWDQSFTIAIVYTSSKIFLYQIYEQIFDNIVVNR